MSPEEIKHFLVMRDHATGEVKVKRFGTDYDAAQVAYANAERAHAEDDLDIVLLSADSLATIRKTHSSYFEAGESELTQLLNA